MKDMLLSLTLLTCLLSHGQNYSDVELARIDSISDVIKTTEQDTIRALALFELANMVYLKEPDVAITYCERAKIISERINFEKGMGEAYSWLGYLYAAKSDVPKAIEYHHKSLKIRERMKDKSGIANSCLNLTQMYIQSGDYDQALEFNDRVFESLEGIETRDAKYMLAAANNNVGTIASKQGDKTKAAIYFNKNIVLLEEIGDLFGLAYTYNNLANIHFGNGEHALALELDLKAVDLRLAMGDLSGLSNSYANVGWNLVKLNRFQEALTYAEKSLALSKQLGFPAEIEQAAKLLSHIYEHQQKGMQALEMYKLYIEMRDSLSNEANHKALVSAQLEYEYDKKTFQDSIQNAEQQKVKDAEIATERIKSEKQEQLTLFALAGLLLAVVFGAFIFSRFRVSQKQKNIIAEQKELVDEKNKEILDSITYAKRIQNAILPSAQIMRQTLQNSFVLYKPKDIVAGDFYWLQQKNNGTTNPILFAAADCTGHGVPGALVSVVCNNALNRAVTEYQLTDPGKILDKTREIVIAEFEKSDENVKDGMDIALCCLEGSVLKFAGAHNPLWLVRSGELTELNANKQPIGKFEPSQHFTTHTVELKAGDSFYIFSDGYSDQFGGDKGKKFKSANFKKLLTSIQHLDMEAQKKEINRVFESWRGSIEQLDDVCVIGVRV